MSKQTKQTTKTKGDGFVDEDVISAGGDYMKFESGENEIRIISKPITGWVVWEEDDDGNKVPKRTPLADGEPEAPSDDPKDKPKKFMAFVVIDRADDGVKICEATQQGVIKGIQALDKNPKWGKPFSYDITVTKTGADKKTRYSVTPSPKTALSKDDIKAANAKRCNLDALYEGENPWEIEGIDELTEYFFK